MNYGRLFFDPSCHGDMLLLGNGDPFFRGGGSVIKMEEMPKKRPFLSSPGELFDDEYYDEQFQEKKHRLTSDQVQMLEKSFEEENKLEPDRKNQLAKKLGLQPRQVAVWFQNRRARWKTKQLERDYGQLKDSYESLLCNYRTVAKENDKLRTEMVLLTEKLQTNEVTGVPESTQGPDLLAAKDLLALSPQLERKVEDHLSCGSGGSAVVDEDAAQLVDCGDSYFPEDDNYPECVVPLNGVQSEEGDGRDNAHTYFTTTVFEMAGQHNYVAGEPMGWWIWS